MLRNVLFALCAFAFGPALIVSNLSAQDPVVDDPAKAALLEDFQVQGEYASANNAGPHRGLQVIALGDGEFELVIYEGGLPGSGWNGEEPRRLNGDADTVDQLVDSQGLIKANRQSPTMGAAPPAGAVHLFDGSAASIEKYWQSGARPTEDGLLMEGVTSIPEFTDYQLHLEFRTPFQPKARGQGRGNSGLYHQSRYETQILDSFGLKGADNETGGIYAVRAPDLNMCFPPLSWQTYDVQFTAARFDESGKKVADARMTVRLNGVVVQNDVAVPDATRAAPLAEGAKPGPIHLQDHGNPVRFRNIWVMPLDAEREARRPIVPGFERFFAAQVETGDEQSLVSGGRVLASSLGCYRCHASNNVAWRTANGPKLTDVANRIRPDHLVQWLANPHGIKPGTSMPDLMTGYSQEERQAMAESIASFLLLAGSEQKMLDRSGDSRSAARGEELYHSVGCLACHAPRDGRLAPASTTVPLGPLEAKYTLDSLAAFLADPHAVRPDGRMPKILAENEARDVATYLLADVVLVPGAQQFARTLYRGWWDDIPDFSTLEPEGDAETVSDLTFDGISPLDGFGAVYEAYLPITKEADYRLTIGSDDGSRVLIDGKEVARVGGVHPYQQNSGSIHLEKGVHRLRVEYFEGGGEERLTLEIEGGDLGRVDVAALVTQDPTGELTRQLVEAQFVPNPESIAEGATLFGRLGCIQCHEYNLSDANAVVIPVTTMAKDWGQLDSAKGCLSAEAPQGLPKYDLNSRQRTALAAAIQADKQFPSDEVRVHETLATANCYACHSRGSLGGPEPTREAFFTTTVQEMGNEGRVPPPLTGIADKLRDETIYAVIDNGANDRPYMRTRMPAFKYEGFKATHEAFVRLDRNTETSLDLESGQVNRLIADGRTLVGNDGLACIKCHTYNGEGTPGIQAIDMRKMTQRLRSEWFDRYLRNPPQYRPGTRMPASFPDGKSVLGTIGDGDPAYQIAAMWQYLALGDASKIPNGLRPGAIELQPVDRPILYRNFLTGLSPRGIAVGYPQQVHLAWDAGQMALAKIWQNQYLDASLHWQGRGPGNLGPLGDAVIEWEKTSPLAALPTIDAAWPEKTDRANGYRFGGYRLNAAGQPTFVYAVAQRKVADFFKPLEMNEAGQRGFERQLEIAAGDSDLVLRLAAGNLKKLAEGRYGLNDQIEVQVTDSALQVVQVNGRDELRLLIPASKAATVRYSIHW